MKTERININTKAADLIRASLYKKENETAAEAYLRLLTLVRLVLTYLDLLEGSLLQKNKMKLHTKGLLKELEFLDADIMDVWKADNHTGHFYEAMEGQRVAIEWVANLSIKELIMVARGGLTCDWQEQQVQAAE